MKIDYVIPYVDGTDEHWQKQFLANKKDCLYNSKEELAKRYSPNILFKYQFRGIEKFAPWINNVHLLVQSESQIPKWINQQNVHVVLHDQFIPQCYLPTYNSGTIECFLQNIPDLATCFIYANDDTYILNDLHISDFFDSVMPLNSFEVKHVNPHNNESFERMNMKITEFICKELGLTYTPNTFYIPSHVQKAMNKQILNMIYDQHKQYVNDSITMFRCDDNISQAFFTMYYQLSTNKKYVNNKVSFIRYDIFNNFDMIIKFFENKKTLPQLFCLNNNDNDKDIAIMCQFEKLFPQKSKYELLEQ